MTIASCGSVSATTLGLPNSTAIPAEKATLPKGLFVAKIPVSAKTKQRLANDIESITMLSLLQARNTKLAAGTRVPEILVIGLRLHEPNAAVPTDIVELIAMQRKSGMLSFAYATPISKVRHVRSARSPSVERCRHVPGTRPHPRCSLPIGSRPARPR